MIEVKHLSKDFGKKNEIKVLRDISETIDKGEKVVARKQRIALSGVKLKDLYDSPVRQTSPGRLGRGQARQERVARSGPFATTFS